MFREMIIIPVYYDCHVFVKIRIIKLIHFDRNYDDNGDNYCTWNIYWLYTDWFICYVATLYQLQKLHSVIWAKYVYALWMWKGGRGSSHGMHKTDIFIFSWKSWGIPWKILSGWLVLWLEFESSTSQIQIGCAVTELTCSDQIL